MVSGEENNLADRRRMEEALEESDEKFRVLVERSFDAIAALDIDGRFTYLSPAVERMTGYRPEELVGRPFKDFLPESETPKVVKAFNELMRGGSIESLQFDVHRRDGSIATLELNAYPILKDGEVTGLQGIFRDFTERKRMEEALRKSEEQLRSIFTSSPDSIIVADLQGNIVDCNQATLRMSGYQSKEEVIGRNALSFIAKRDHEKAMENTKKTLEQGLMRNMEYTYLAKDGREYPAELSVSIIKDSSGNPIGFVGLTKDITERKKMEEELRTRARLLDAAMDSIFLHDFEGNLLYVNEAACRSQGYRRDELMRMNLHDLDAPGYAELAKARIKELMERGEAILESAHVRKDKSMMPIEVHARIIESGGKKLVLSVARDITERKRLEEMRDRFISAATHELRTPLVSIKGYVDYILTGRLGPVPERVESSLEVVRRNTDQLLRITDDLLDMQRLATGRLPLNITPLSFREVIEHCLREVRPLLDGKGQSLRLEAPRDPLLIHGDRVRLSQVVMNLLSNAVKFTPQGGDITVRVQDEGDALQVQVSDTGIGIRREDLERVFQPFAEIKKPIHVKGTGLGLSVAKGLVEAHGGRMWAQSEGEGKGSTFTFTLPKRRVKEVG